MLLDGHSYRLTIGTVELIDHEMEFEVIRSGSSEPNTANFTISNIGESTRRALSQESKIPILFEAGYAADIALMFKGKVLKSSTQRMGATWKTTIEASDGAAEISLRKFMTFPPGKKREDAVREMAAEMGLGSDKDSPIVKLIDYFKEKGAVNGIVEFFNGFTTGGDNYKAIVDLAKPLGIDVSIQDEILTANLSDKGVNRNKAVRRIAADTGMLGSPELGDKGAVRVTSLLLPTVRPNDPVKLVSTLLEGNYRVDKMTSTGSYRHGPWKTDLDLTPI